MHVTEASKTISGKNLTSDLHRISIHNDVVLGSVVLGGMTYCISEDTINRQHFPPEVKKEYINDLYYPIGLGLILYCWWVCSSVRKLIRSEHMMMSHDSKDSASLNSNPSKE